jgi:hypothetical protein
LSQAEDLRAATAAGLTAAAAAAAAISEALSRAILEILSGSSGRLSEAHAAFLDAKLQPKNLGQYFWI